MEMIIYLGMNKTGGSFLKKNIFPKMESKVTIKGMLSGNPIRKTSDSDEVFIREMIAYGIYYKYGRETKIIVGFREKDEWLKSCYNQYIKGMSKGYLSFNKWKDLYFDINLLDYKRYFNLLNKLFDNVFIYDFDALKNNKKELIEKLCTFCNCETIEYDDIIVNKRLGRLKLSIFRVINFSSESMKYIIRKI